MKKKILIAKYFKLNSRVEAMSVVSLEGIPPQYQDVLKKLFAECDIHQEGYVTQEGLKIALSRITGGKVYFHSTQVERRSQMKNQRS